MVVPTATVIGSSVGLVPRNALVVLYSRVVGNSHPGYVLIAGGIGITPLFSMCLTLADREDVRPVFLFYDRREHQELTFRDELDQLTRRMNLKVIYVLEHASEDWAGETGLIDSDLLRRYLPKQYKRFQYFVCGPLAMMDAMEKLLPEIGIAPEYIHTERFDIV